MPRMLCQRRQAYLLPIPAVLWQVAEARDSNQPRWCPEPLPKVSWAPCDSQVLPFLMVPPPPWHHTWSPTTTQTPHHSLPARRSAELALGSRSSPGADRQDGDPSIARSCAGFRRDLRGVYKDTCARAQRGSPPGEGVGGPRKPAFYRQRTHSPRGRKSAAGAGFRRLRFFLRKKIEIRLTNGSLPLELGLRRGSPGDENPTSSAARRKRLRGATSRRGT